jgi:plasmid stabilization system protein ParE
MSKKIIWTPESEKTFSSIISYLEKEWSSYVLLTFLDKVDQVIALIADKPELFPAVDKEKHLHKCVVVKQISLL